MKRYISAKERKSYTHMLEIIIALGGKDLEYKWLISSFEAYPQKRGKYADLIENNEYIILSSEELTEMLSEDDFQWIWAVLSAIPLNTSNEDILKYELPSADNGKIYKDNSAIIQHPLAEIEIVACDSSSVSLVAKDEEMAEKFKALFPKSKTNF